MAVVDGPASVSMGADTAGARSVAIISKARIADGLTVLDASADES